ncbi:MAG: BlaI/MecI/CopY family transcriptional regulator [Gemmatimonadota bacterium]
MASAPTLPTGAELDILRILWARGPSSVRDVHERLDNDTTYTSTLKLMQMMFAKGYVRRDDAQRQHVYEAVIEQNGTLDGLVSRFVRHVFDGSAGALAVRALGEGSATREELKELKRLIREMERDPDRK